MTIEFVSGDLLDALDRKEVDVIGHIVNCQGVMGSGIAKSIKDRYPAVYKEYRLNFDLGAVNLLGLCQQCFVSSEIGDNREVFNLHAQFNYGLDKRHLNYGALGICLASMSRRTIHKVVGFPFKMGSDRAGGDFSIVLEMIEFYFKDHIVKIYKL